MNNIGREEVLDFVAFGMLMPIHGVGPEIQISEIV